MPLPLEICGKLDTDIYSSIFIKHLETINENFKVSNCVSKSATFLEEDEQEDISIEYIENAEDVFPLTKSLEDWLSLEDDNWEDFVFPEESFNNQNNISLEYEEDFNPYVNSIVDFVWYPTKQEWDIFYKKYQETDYDTAIEFLINDILKFLYSNHWWVPEIKAPDIIDEK